MCSHLHTRLFYLCTLSLLIYWSFLEPSFMYYRDNSYLPLKIQLFQEAFPASLKAHFGVPSFRSILYIIPVHSFLPHYVCISWVAQSCLTLCNPMDYSPPGSSVLGILQARILEWVAIPFSRDETQGWKPGLLHCRRILYHLCNQGSPLPHYMKIITYGPYTSEDRNLLYSLCPWNPAKGLA